MTQTYLFDTVKFLRGNEVIRGASSELFHESSLSSLTEALNVFIISFEVISLHFI